MPELHGKQMIAGELSSQGDARIRGVNPATGQPMAPAYHEATAQEIDRAMTAAEACFDALRTSPCEQRATLLEAIGERIMALGDALLERAHAETGLPMQRLTAERARTVNQAKLFAAMIRDGSWLCARIDRPQPDRQPLPKPDVRSMLMPVGPVVVFGASNFPLAIGVAGTDTVCALGAGCPVVVKGHPAHPGMCELLATAVTEAIAQCGLPAGIFSLVHGASNEVGVALVRHPSAKAAAFTGSLRGGRALFDEAVRRPEPIPFYAEMGSTNPLFVLPGALRQRAEAIAEGYIGSVTMGVGQFCTCPSAVLGVKGDVMSRFTEAVRAAAAKAAPATMLHAGIRNAYDLGVERIGATPGVKRLAQSADKPNPAATQAACTIFHAPLDVLNDHRELLEEVFGPTSIIFEADAPADLEQFAESLGGHLTATLHGTEQDLADHRRLLTILQRKVGRLVFNGYPTGIEVCAAMHHGGPYPATTDSHYTSIGSASIYRFVRPLCYQNFPQSALPPELQNPNTRNLWRVIDGQLTRENV